MRKHSNPPVLVGAGKSFVKALCCIVLLLSVVFITENSFAGNKVEGKVTFESGQIAGSGNVIIYRLHDLYRYPIFIAATQISSNGSYKVSIGSIEDTIYALAIPGSGQYVPTYFPTDIDFSEAGDIIFPGPIPGNNTQNGDIVVIVQGSTPRPGMVTTSVSGVIENLNENFTKSEMLKAYVYAMSGDDIAGYSEVSSDGSYNISNLSEGSYRLMFTGVGFETKNINVELKARNKNVYNFDTRTTPTEEYNNASPDAIILIQNYPNPFNPSTDISFSIPVNSLVKLQVFDAAGRQVALLVNGELSSGFHTVQFNAQNLTSGIYFYKLTTGGFTETKKMLLIK